jgi:predicted O-methyltransferase YrrM
MMYLNKFFNLIFKYPKYFLLILEILITNRVKKISHIHKKVSAFDYEDIEGFLVPEQLLALEKYAKNKNNILEIGFNLGHTTEAFIKNSSASVVSLDIFIHSYSWISMIYFLKNFYKRIKFLKGDSRVILQKLVSENKKFDLILIDGGHSFEVAKSDIQNSLNLINSNGIILIDNLEIDTVKQAINIFLDNNKIEFISQELFSNKKHGLSDIGVYKKT